MGRAEPGAAARRGRDQVPFDDNAPQRGDPRRTRGQLGSFFTYTSQGPDARTPKRRYGVHGNSFVKVIEFGPAPKARSILTFGQNGDPASPHYLDQLPIYAARGMKVAWSDRATVEANAERTYSPGDP